jgi:hypothetical protein
MSEEQYYIKAKKIAKAKRDFRMMLWVFVLLTPVLIFINLFTSPEYLWFLWSILGFGIATVAMYYEAYVKPKHEERESHEVEKEMERLRLHDRKIVKNDSLDEHLDLRELRKDYDERDFV